MDPDEVERAAARTRGRVRRTPTMELDGVVLKLELLQLGGSFKPRGAFNRVLAASERPTAGIVAASGGNHGIAVAAVGADLGIPAEVFVPSTSPDVKRRAIESFGAAVTVVDGYYADAQRAAERRQAITGAMPVHPYEHPHTIAGQGTMGRELDDEGIRFDTILVACGGGGLIAGQAAWFGDRVKIVGVEPERSQCLRRALDAGRPVDVDVAGVAADSLGAPRIGALAWRLAERFVDDAVVVTDDAIRGAQRDLWRRMRLVVEPGGAAAWAALRSGRYVPERSERVVAVVCGSNCDPAAIAG